MKRFAVDPGADADHGALVEALAHVGERRLGRRLFQFVLALHRCRNQSLPWGGKLK